LQLKPLDDLIRRYEAGERSPELIQALNEAAWAGFHDPWETPPGPKTREEEDMADDPVDESIYDMEAVRPLSQGMIKRFLRMKGWSFWEWPAPDFCTTQKVRIWWLGHPEWPRGHRDLRLMVA
jgi:hypothetical protein